MKNKITTTLIAFILINAFALLGQNYEIGVTPTAQADSATASTTISVRFTYNFYGQNISESTASVRTQEAGSLTLLNSNSSFIPGSSSQKDDNSQAVVLFKGPELEYLETDANNSLKTSGNVILSQGSEDSNKISVASNVNFSTINNKSRFQNVPEKSEEMVGIQAVDHCQSQAGVALHFNQNSNNSACNFAIAVTLDGNNTKTPVLNMLLTSM